MKLSHHSFQFHWHPSSNPDRAHGFHLREGIITQHPGETRKPRRQGRRIRVEVNEDKTLPTPRSGSAVAGIGWDRTLVNALAPSPPANGRRDRNARHDTGIR